MVIDRKVIGFAVVILIAAGGVSFYIFSDLQKISEKQLSEIPPDMSEEVSPGASGSARNSEGAASHPDLNRPIVVNAHVSKNQEAQIRAKLEEIILLLRDNPAYYDAWIDLGIYRKEAGDYEGAKEAWQYATDLNPNRSVAYGNLGVLYGYYLPDHQKSEQNFLIAISLDPSYLYLYGQLSDFYRNVLNDTQKAKDILQKAADANPEQREEIEKIIASF